MVNSFLRKMLSVQDSTSCVMMALSPRQRRRLAFGQLVAGAVFLAAILARRAAAVALTDGRSLAMFDQFDAMLVLSYATFWGSMPASAMTFVLFAVHTFEAGDFAFTDFGLLLCAIAADIPVRLRWYQSRGRTALAALLFAGTFGLGWGVVFRLLSDGTIEQTRLTAFSALLALLPSVPVAVAARLYFTRAGEKWMRRTLPGLFYSAEFRAECEVRTAAVRPRLTLSHKISLIIWIEALTLMAIAVAAAWIMHPGIDPTANFLRLPPRTPNVRFYAKLALLLVNATIPLAQAVNLYAQFKIAQPVQLMTTAMRDFTSDVLEEGRSSVLDINLLRIRTGDEIEELHRTLCATADRLSSYIDRIKNEKRLEENLRVAVAANRAKSAFLSNMSHEIRTPINAVLGMDEMILRESSEEAIRGYAADIKSAGRSLLGIVNDILDFSKIEAGKMEISPVEYDLGSAVNDLVSMVASRARDKGLYLRVEVDPATPRVLRGDDVRIKQCALNVLTNAVKYTEKGGVTLSVSFARQDAAHVALTVRVADTGIGIREEDIPRLYDAFERLDEERNRTVEGTGLGMNIVRRLLSMMGSELRVESEYGRGSEFSFTVRQRVLNWEPVGDFSGSYRRSEDANGSYEESFRAPSARILVVDDTKLNLTVVKGLLKRTQIRVDTAESGLAALSLARENEYDVLFIDHRMPNMDGIETLRAMRQIEGWANAGRPCVALTANAISGAREHYLAEGFDDYLSKPVDAFRLEAMLLKYLPESKVERTERAAEIEEAGAEAEFAGIEGIDAKAALANCWSADVLREALADFRAAIPEKSAAIERFAAARDWKNYTVLVHALKSSARLIGATELSEEARRLEKCGDEGDAEAISAGTPGLVAMYKGYAQRLAAFAPSSDGRPEISPEQLSEAYDALAEGVRAFDFATADAVVATLEGYTLPEGERGRFARLRSLVHAVDRDAILSLLESRG